MTQDLQKLRELAERVKGINQIVELGAPTLYGLDAKQAVAAVRLADAVLSATEPEKPKETRKIAGWAVIDKEDNIFYLLKDEADARRRAEVFNKTFPLHAPHWPCYVTGTEGVGPEDATKKVFDGGISDHVRAAKAVSYHFWKLAHRKSDVDLAAHHIYTAFRRFADELKKVPQDTPKAEEKREVIS